jgi:hypothetical protein
MSDAVTDNEYKEETDAGAREKQPIPVGIARIREEWRQAGLVEEEAPAALSPEAEPVIFTEVDGGAGVGDYTVEVEAVADRLALSSEAVDRLVASGELDSLLVKGEDGQARRLVSESSLARFQEDSAIDPDAIKRAAKAFADKSVAAAIDDLKAEIDDLKVSQGKILQQMKDMLLLEIRNLKEQDRDLTSYVYELVEEIRDAFPKKRRR